MSNVTIDLEDRLLDPLLKRAADADTSIANIINQALDSYLTEAGSVLNPWVRQLTHMQQSVLLAMIRNADGIAKHHPQKELIKWFRRCVLQSAFDRAQLYHPDTPGGGSFTGPVTDIHAALDQFIWARDEMTLHYFAHAMHAFEILGYKYPDTVYRTFWRRAYERCVDALHMLPETESMMDRRLCDNENFWREREDKCGGCSSTERKDVPSDGAIYAAVSQANQEKDAVDEILSTRDWVSVDAPGDQPVPPFIIQPVPAWAKVRQSDGRFVNASTGLDLGNEFEMIWGARKSEFEDYDESRDLAKPGDARPFYDDPIDKAPGGFKGIV